jgi:hypothetical protein
VFVPEKFFQAVSYLQVKSDIYFRTYEWAQYVEACEGKTLAYWSHLLVTKKIKCCEYDPSTESAASF